MGGAKQLLNSVERYIILYDSGDSKPATQEPVTPTPATPREMERVRGGRLAPAKKLVSFLHSQSLPLSWGIPPKEEEEKGRETPPLGVLVCLRDWIRVARRLVPLLGQGAAAPNKCSFIHFG
jgi:hypothetical protein